MSEELKPCPFCNGQPELILPHGESYPQVRCTGCNAEVSARFGKIAAINEWNTRPIEDALRADLSRLCTENAVMQQLGEYDAIRAKQARYKMYLDDDLDLPKLSECLRGCIGDIEKQYPVHAWGLSLTIENIEAMIIDRTELRAELTRKDEEIKAMNEFVSEWDEWNRLACCGVTTKRESFEKLKSARARLEEMREGVTP